MTNQGWPGSIWVTLAIGDTASWIRLFMSYSTLAYPTSRRKAFAGPRRPSPEFSESSDYSHLCGICGFENGLSQLLFPQRCSRFGIWGEGVVSIEAMHWHGSIYAQNREIAVNHPPPTEPRIVNSCVFERTPNV